MDENIPNVTISELRAMGHDVLDIRGAERQGMLDDELWPFAQTEQRIRVTTDKGFLRAPRRAALRHLGDSFAAAQRATDSCADHAVFRHFTEHDWPGLLVVMRDAVQSVHRA